MCGQQLQRPQHRGGCFPCVLIKLPGGAGVTHPFYRWGVEAQRQKQLLQQPDWIASEPCKIEPWSPSWSHYPAATWVASVLTDGSSTGKATD